MTNASHNEAPSCRIRLEPERHDELHADLDHWRANVGDPVSVNCTVRAPASISGVDVLCWNVAIGLGRLDHVLHRLRTDSVHRAGVDETRPLIILIQEAFRSDDSVPDVPGGAHHGGKVPATARTDIVEFARAHGLALRQGEYRLVQDRDAKLRRYQVVFPVQGSYPAVRRFVGAVLDTIPVAALDQVSFERKRIDDNQVDAQVRLTLFLAEP